MSRNPEVSGQITHALNILSSVEDLNETEHHLPFLYRMLRHGRIESDIATILYTHFPEDLAKDQERYGGILPLQEVQFAYVFHDLGKPFTTSDGLMWYWSAKPNPQEYVKIKHHGQFGFNRLLFAEQLPLVVYDIMRWHHEKNDKSGPEGLPAYELPHIVQDAVVIDQVISRCQGSSFRNNRFTLYEALEEVSEGLCTKFNEETFEKIYWLFRQNEHMKVLSLHWLGNYQDKNFTA